MKQLKFRFNVIKIDLWKYENKKTVPIKESDSSISSGEYSGPLELGMKKWESNYLFIRKEKKENE